MSSTTDLGQVNKNHFVESLMKVQVRVFGCVSAIHNSDMKEIKMER